MLMPMVSFKIFIIYIKAASVTILVIVAVCVGNYDLRITSTFCHAYTIASSKISIVRTQYTIFVMADVVATEPQSYSLNA